MNKFRISFKASPTPTSPTKSEHDELTESMASDEDPKRKPLPELDLQLVSDDARAQFADILGRVGGKKDIVIQPELLSLLDHVTPIAFLKK